ncbi:hypothetical protein F5X71_19825 [Nocardia brasiliensis]|uniref:Uncharacterized protein n=1 Tax=Nocardia brasiliensis TaxID=37326 RepID=A0A6G9XTX9_NOCBR|nr:hypothetical protein [Nocardia brasiliensis]QIS04283.1 hypothetical protein F5X71_19825 [Nocardia brasiliensis]
MTKERRSRLLTVGELQYRWKTYHHHVDGCEEVLRLRQIGSAAGLTLVFAPMESAESRTADSPRPATSESATAH